MRNLFRFALVLALALSAFVAVADEDHGSHAGDPEQLGAVDFSISCAPAANSKFLRAVAMLHSFWYAEAEREFAAAAELDPTCAIARWGIAMTHWHPLWEPRGPEPEALQAGLMAINKAERLKGSERERAFVGALAKFYAGAGMIDHRDRVLAYEKAMQALYERAPDDTEARAFYALSLLSSATSLPPDPGLQRQRKAGALLEPVVRAFPQHPGAAHYLIHAYDYPELAAGALDAARAYAAIAPDSPHAQHMPSHIFTRLGLWDESIKSNRSVMRVAQKYGAVGEELHARDYLLFALLQKGETEQARQVIEEMPAPEPPGSDSFFASIYARAAMPARFAVERKAWSEAADLKLPAGLPGGRYAWADATIYFARALGAARSGDVDKARRNLALIEQSQRELVKLKEDSWATQVEIQERAAAAWIALAENRPGLALEQMRSAADLEDTTSKHPVTPGQIVPARDLLGQMLLELGRPADALTAFTAVLAKEPGRHSSRVGADQARTLLQKA